MADDAPPDRLSNDPDSPYYNAELLERGIGIRLQGQEKTNVERVLREPRLGPRRRRQGARPQRASR